MKAYIAAPYTSKATRLDNSRLGKITDTSYINFLESIESTVKSLGFQTFLPHKDLHNWGEANLNEEEAVKKSFQQMRESDLVISCPEESGGAHIELGWASSLRKKVFILLNENGIVSFMHAGLNSITDTTIIKFRDVSDLRIKLREELANIKEQL